MRGERSCELRLQLARPSASLPNSPPAHLLNSLSAHFPFFPAAHIGFFGGCREIRIFRTQEIQTMEIGKSKKIYFSKSESQSPKMRAKQKLGGENPLAYVASADHWQLDICPLIEKSTRGRRQRRTPLNQLLYTQQEHTNGCGDHS